MMAISEESWERAFRAVKEMFEIANLLPEQENSPREFLLGQYIFVNLPTVRRTLFSKGLMVPVLL